MARQANILSPRGLASLKLGESRSEAAARGEGRLQARRVANGIVFYYRYTAPDGSRVRIPLGAYDEEGRRGLSLKQARDKMGELRRRYRDGSQNLRGTLADEAAEAERERAARARAAEAEEARKAGTLGVLLTQYVDSLEAAGKPSAREVRAMFARNVEEPHHALWATPAIDITHDDGVTLLSTPATAGKVREAGKLRSYLRAAFSYGVKARSNPRAPQDLRALGLRTNPFLEIPAIDGASKSRARALSVAELRAYWRRIKELAGPHGAMLRFHLLTGGQRVEQLARITVAHVDRDTNTMQMLDFKGRRKEPRVHVVPLVPLALKAIDAMGSDQTRPFVFSVTGGETPADYSTTYRTIAEVVDVMKEANELEGGAFTAGDLRRTVETRLAALGVAKHVRAHVQSHGLGGVQDRNYDRHDYLDEKRAALDALYNLITGTTATVTRMKARKSA